MSCAADRSRDRAWRRALATLAFVTVATSCASTDDGGRAATTTAGATTTTTTAGAATATTPPSTGDPVVLAAGDIASCGGSGDEATAALLASHPVSVVVTLGDNVYGSGSRREFADCYDGSWGASRERTRPSPGNHDYATDDAAGYFGYFGEAAGDPAKGYYSYDVGSWHLVALNSNCSAVSCAAGDAQERWLRADLATSSSRCILGYWHHPRFSSGRTHGSSTAVAPLWQALFDAGADLVLSGHEHNYERFAPLDPSGRVDGEKGIRSFVVGTGGRSHYAFGDPLSGSEVRNHGTFGVLRLTLSSSAFDWAFVPVPGESFTDSGSGACH